MRKHWPYWYLVARSRFFVCRHTLSRSERSVKPKERSYTPLERAARQGIGNGSLFMSLAETRGKHWVTSGVDVHRLHLVGVFLHITSETLCVYQTRYTVECFICAQKDALCTHCLLWQFTTIKFSLRLEYQPVPPVNKTCTSELPAARRRLCIQKKVPINSRLKLAFFFSEKTRKICLSRQVNSDDMATTFIYV